MANRCPKGSHRPLVTDPNVDLAGNIGVILFIAFAQRRRVLDRLSMVQLTLGSCPLVGHAGENRVILQFSDNERKVRAMAD